MASENNYAARYDLKAKIVSTLACVLVFGAALIVHNLVVAAVALFLFALTYAYSPRGYRIAEGWLFVRRWAGDVPFPLSTIRESRRAAPEDFHRALRLWGSGGIFGYYGIFSTAKLGKCTWYLTNRKNAVVLVTGSKTILVSPEDPDRFLQAIAPH